VKCDTVQQCQAVDTVTCQQCYLLATHPAAAAVHLILPAQ